MDLQDSKSKRRFSDGPEGVRDRSPEAQTDMDRQFERYGVATCKVEGMDA